MSFLIIMNFCRCGFLAIEIANPFINCLKIPATSTDSHPTKWLFQFSAAKIRSETELFMEGIQPWNGTKLLLFLVQKSWHQTEIFNGPGRNCWTDLRCKISEVMQNNAGMKLPKCICLGRFDIIGYDSIYNAHIVLPDMSARTGQSSLTDTTSQT